MGSGEPHIGPHASWQGYADARKRPRVADTRRTHREASPLPAAIDGGRRAAVHPGRADDKAARDAAAGKLAEAEARLANLQDREPRYKIAMAKPISPI